MQDVMNALRRAIATALPRHPVLASLDEYAAHLATPGALPLGGVPFEMIADFRASEAQPQAAWLGPGEWLTRTPLQGIRVQLVRPGIPRPATADTSWGDSLLLSAAAATYREQFRNLDLEIRLQIITIDQTLRAGSVKAVRDALAGLRAADRAAR
jgi:hypothetical protein